VAASSVQLQFLGSGDAFGSGGRFQACILLSGAGANVLIDCGATSLTAMKRFAVDPSSIETVIISHLHGDHFGGLPFLILDGQFSRRETPLLIAGPPTIEERTTAAMEVLFPGSAAVRRRFSVEYTELAPKVATPAGPAVVTGYPVEHESGAPAYGLRIEYGGRTIAYSGDTEWTDELLELAGGADLFICEAYFFDKTVKFHLDYSTLQNNLARLDCSRVVVTHMHQTMLDRADEISLEAAEDGLVLRI
jgi:ribonuclease BN (tRNA processing enzyme)